MQSPSSYSNNLEATSNDDKVNGGVLQFPNKICLCGLRALIKSSANPKKLYYKCGKLPKQYDYFEWWTSCNAERRLIREGTRPNSYMDRQTSNEILKRIRMVETSMPRSSMNRQIY